MEQIAKNIERLINASGKKKYEIADELGISAQVISDYIAGRSIPSVPTLIKLCKSLDCTYEDILGKLE